MIGDNKQIRTPMQGLVAIHDKMKQDSKPLSELPVGQMLRFFNEGVKNIDQKLHDELKNDLGAHAQSALKELSEKAKNWNPPVNETYFKDMTEQLKEFDKDFAEDPGWNNFWEQYKKENPSLSDERVQELQQQILYAYHFKVMQKVFIDGMKENPSPDILKKIKAFNKFQQDLNGAILRAPIEQTPYDYVERLQKDTFGSNFVDSINNVVANAIALKAKGGTVKEIEAEIEKGRLAVFNELAGAPGGENYSTYFGMDKAKEAFNEIFSVEKILSKANNYQTACQQVGFDIDSEIRRINYLTGGSNKLTSSEKKKLGEYIGALKSLAYYVPGTTNVDIQKKSSPEEIKQLHQESIAIIEDRKSDLSDEFSQKLIGIAENGNLMEFGACYNIVKDCGVLMPEDEAKVLNLLLARMSNTSNAPESDEHKQCIQAINDLKPTKKTLNNALIQAAEQGNTFNAKILLDFGASPLVLNNQGETILEIARKSGNLSSAQLKEWEDYANKKMQSGTNLDDFDQEKLFRSYCVVKHTNEIFEYGDSLHTLDVTLDIVIQMHDMEKTPETQALLNNAIKDTYEKYIDQYSTRPEIPLNLLDDNPKVVQECVDEIGRNKEKIKNGTLTNEERENVINTFKTLHSAYRNYVVSTIPKNYQEILANKLPLHAIAQSKDFLTGSNNIENTKVLTAVLKEVDVNQKDPSGQTALQLAANLGNRVLVNKLLEKGADPSLKTTQYKRNLFTRAKDSIAGLLSGKGLVHWKSPPERTASEIAKISGHTNISETIQGKEKNWKPPEKEQAIELTTQVVPKTIDTTIPEVLISKIPDLPPIPETPSPTVITSLPKRKMYSNLNLLLGQLDRDIENFKKDGGNLKQIASLSSVRDSLLDATKISSPDKYPKMYQAIQKALETPGIENTSVAKTLKQISDVVIPSVTETVQAKAKPG